MWGVSCRCRRFCSVDIIRYVRVAPVCSLLGDFLCVSISLPEKDEMQEGGGMFMVPNSDAYRPAGFRAAAEAAHENPE